MAVVYLKNKVIKMYKAIIKFIALCVLCNIIFYSYCVASTQTELVRLSEIVRQNETELSKLKDEQEKLALQQQHIKQKITEYQKALSTTVVSAYKLNSLPSKLLVSNSNNNATAVAYSLFAYYHTYLKQKTNSFNEYIQLVKQNEITLNNLQNKINHINYVVAKNKKQLQAMLANNNTNVANIKQSNANLVKQQSNIAYLINKISNNNLLLKQEQQEDNNLEKNYKNKFVWPSAGYIESNFLSNNNPMYKNGITLVTLPQSQIVSPMHGEVVFIDNGNYLDLNNIIIIKHSASYYSVLIGNFKPFVMITQLVQTHEPIAITHNKSSLLYFEMQYQNQPINPNNWLVKR